MSKCATDSTYGLLHVTLDVSKCQICTSLEVRGKSKHVFRILHTCNKILPGADDAWVWIRKAKKKNEILLPGVMIKGHGI